MKTLIINGSPRKNGATSALANALAKKLQGEVRIVETHYANISPCVDCRHCWDNDGCIINDNMQDLYEYIKAADNIIIASPIYFAEITGSLLQWASRLQYFWVAKNFRKQDLLSGKKIKGAVILADGGEGRYENALAMGKRLLNIMSAPCADYIYLSGSDYKRPETILIDDEIISKIEHLANILNEEK